MNPEENQIQIRVARIIENEPKKVLIQVCFLTKLRGLTLVRDDLSYKGNIVDLKLKVVHDGSKSFKYSFPCVCSFESRNDTSENDKEAIKFDKTNHNVMLVTIKDIPTTTKPTGTRRKVVIYEDTDIIDSGDTPKT